MGAPPVADAATIPCGATRAVQAIAQQCDYGASRANQGWWFALPRSSVGAWGPRKVVRPCGERRAHHSGEGCPEYNGGSARLKRRLRPTSAAGSFEAHLRAVRICFSRLLREKQYSYPAQPGDRGLGAQSQAYFGSFCTSKRTPRRRAVLALHPA